MTKAKNKRIQLSCWIVQPCKAVRERIAPSFHWLIIFYNNQRHLLCSPAAVLSPCNGKSDPTPISLTRLWRGTWSSSWPAFRRRTRSGTRTSREFGGRWASPTCFSGFPDRVRWRDSAGWRWPRLRSTFCLLTASRSGSEVCTWCSASTTPSWLCPRWRSAWPWRTAMRCWSSPKIPWALVIMILCIFMIGLLQPEPSTTLPCHITWSSRSRRTQRGSRSVPRSLEGPLQFRTWCLQTSWRSWGTSRSITPSWRSARWGWAPRLVSSSETWCPPWRAAWQSSWNGSRRPSHWTTMTRTRTRRRRRRREEVRKNPAAGPGSSTPSRRKASRTFRLRPSPDGTARARWRTRPAPVPSRSRRGQRSGRGPRLCGLGPGKASAWQRRQRVRPGFWAPQRSGKAGGPGEPAHGRLSLRSTNKSFQNSIKSWV